MDLRIVAVCAVLAARPAFGAGVPATPAASRGLVGSWTAGVPEDRADRMYLSLHMGSHEHSSSTFDRSQFTGLTSAQVNSATRVQVEFELRREAGTIAFEGLFRDGRGAGEFTFVPNRELPRMLRSLGVEFTSKRGSEDEELFTLAMFDVSTDFIRSLQAVGYTVPLEQYEQFRIFDVNPKYVREMAATGFDHLSAEKLVETRIHGASPEYIREMRAAGNDLSLDEYIQSRIFQITPEFAAEMGRAGYTNLDHDMLVQFRIHGVTPAFVREIRQLGYSRVPAEDLVAMRIHGVTPEFIRRVEAAGYRKVPVEKLVQMRIFNIEPEMVKALDQGDRPD